MPRTPSILAIDARRGKRLNIYEGLIYPRIFEHSAARFDTRRRELLSAAKGDVLEIGFGTGLNLPHYPTLVRSLTALDPRRLVDKRIEQRIARASFPVVRVQLSADRHLPFGTATFDCVVSTWALCMVARPEIALAEIRRILKPRGAFIFLEPGRSKDADLARWQTRFSPFFKSLTCGTCFDLEIERLLQNAGFKIPKLANFVLDARPRFLRHMYQGIARVI